MSLIPARLQSLIVQMASLVVLGVGGDHTTDGSVDGTDPAAHDSAVRDRGQATTEYALVMLAAALVALLVVAWATAGGGAGKIGRLFDRILDEVIGRV